jgi:hypothetical protein
LPLYLKLNRDDQDFIEFFLSSSSIKEMAKQAGNSYPTMRNKMDDLIEKLKFKIIMAIGKLFNPFSKFSEKQLFLFWLFFINSLVCFYIQNG